MYRDTLLTLPHVTMDEVDSLYNSDLRLVQMPKFNIGGMSNLKKGAVFNETYSDKATDDIFTVYTGSGSKIIIVSDSCARPEYGREVCCWWCSWRYKGYNCGIFIDLNIKDDTFNFTRYGYTCSAECSLAFVKNEMLKGRNCPVQYRSSERYHNIHHHLTNPNAGPLIPSNSRSLLYELGGSLTRDAWTKGSYTPNHNIIIVDSKSTYSKS